MHTVHISADGTALQIATPDMEPWSIHPLWLRERCQDAASLDPITEQRLFNPSDLPPAINIAHIAEHGSGHFTITFTDGTATAIAAADILAELPANQNHALPPPHPWMAASQPPVAFAWPDCQQEAVLRRVLHDYLVHGYVILRDVPAQHGAVLEVGRRFGFPRETNFGLLFDVKSVPNATDLAYTALPLDPHTDNPYRTPVPGIQLLHCLVNETTGGLSTLVDGMAVARALRETDPTLHDILAATAMRFRYVDAGTELIASAPLLQYDHAGRFAAIHYSPRLDFVPLLDPATLALFYTARRALDRLLRSEHFERRFKLENGDLMMFDNRRLLHGRTGFDPATGLRHLQGCYIDADGPASQYRVLSRHRA